MDTRQKIGLFIMTPLFAIAAGHTIINKFNMEKQNNVKLEVVGNKDCAAMIKNLQNINNAAGTELDNIDSEFKKQILEYNRMIRDGQLKGNYFRSDARADNDLERAAIKAKYALQLGLNHVDDKIEDTFN